MAVLGEIIKNLSLDNESVVVVDDTLRAAIQRRLLETLDDIMDVCEHHGIRWQMSGGSALGTLRHRGFIPWDDDIDINMERAEVERFLPLFREKYGDKYWVQVPGEDDDYDYLLIHIMTRDVYARELMQKKEPHLGLCLDIFIVENLPDNPLLRRLHGCLVMGLRYVLSCFRFRENRAELLMISHDDASLKKYLAVRSTLGTVFGLIPKRYWVRWANRALALCGNRQSKYVGIPTGTHQYFRELYPRDPFCRSKQAVFEGRHVWISEYIDGYMTIMYGDYRSLPPLENRGRHTFMEMDVDALADYIATK